MHFDLFPQTSTAGDTGTWKSSWQNELVDWSCECSAPEDLLSTTSFLRLLTINNNFRKTFLPVKCFLQSHTPPSVLKNINTKELLLESLASCVWWINTFRLSMFSGSNVGENLFPCSHSSSPSRVGAAISFGKMSSMLIRLMSFFSSSVGGYFIFTLKTLAFFPFCKCGLVSFRTSSSSPSSTIGSSGSSSSPTTSVWEFVFR